jgi:hypothetical protein
LDWEIRSYQLIIEAAPSGHGSKELLKLLQVAFVAELLGMLLAWFFSSMYFLGSQDYRLVESTLAKLEALDSRK